MRFPAEFAAHYATLVTEPVYGVEITWEVLYYWSKPTPATYLDPPEGGLELDGTRPIEVTWCPMDGESLTIGGIQEGSILDLLLTGKYGPTENECWEAAGEHNAARLEDTRW